MELGNLKLCITIYFTNLNYLFCIMYCDFYRVVGFINGVIFNTANIMLKDLEQDISGFKIFKQNFIIPNALEFKDIKLQGTINNIDLANFIHTQVNKMMP